VVFVIERNYIIEWILKLQKIHLLKSQYEIQLAFSFTKTKFTMIKIIENSTSHTLGLKNHEIIFVLSNITKSMLQFPFKLKF
jgi:hypothetical protein